MKIEGKKVERKKIEAYVEGASGEKKAFPVIGQTEAHALLPSLSLAELEALNERTRWYNERANQ